MFEYSLKPVRSNTVRSLAIQLQDFARSLRELEKLHYDYLKGKKNPMEKETENTEKDKMMAMSNSKVFMEEMTLANCSRY